MPRPSVLLLFLAATLSGCNAIKGAVGVIGDVITSGTPASADLPRTRAERTQYTETSRYEDVNNFLDSLQTLGIRLHVGSIGRSTEGRDIPYVIASRPLVSTPAEARRLGRPIVYVQGNIHAGEVEGKEAMLALVRDLLASSKPNVLDSIVLIVVPIYNTDGNEKFASQSKNRTEQNGPELVGVRPNGQGLDLNRDYVKAEALETRGSLAMFEKWDPDVFVDLHTTDGSFHGYALTYSPSLNPAAMYGGVYARDSILPELRRRVRSRHQFETFDYGNFDLTFTENPADSVKQGWYSYDHRPRFGSNYYGMRGRIGILSEAYSHDPFERRVKATYAFVTELLSLVAERSEQVLEVAVHADQKVEPSTGACFKSAGKRVYSCNFGSGATQGPSAENIPIRSELTKTPIEEDVIVERLVSTGDSSQTEPGVPRGLRRTGRFYTQRMPVFDRFTPTLTRKLPEAYAIANRAEIAPIISLLRLHGLRIEQLEQSWSTNVESMTIDSIGKATRLFQGHNEVTLAGRWTTARRTLDRGTYLISTAQPLGVLAAYLLEPESDDGLATWNLFDAMIRRGEEFPVVRIIEPVTAPRRVQ